MLPRPTSLAAHPPNEEIVPGIKEVGEVDLEVGHGQRFVLPIAPERPVHVPTAATMESVAAAHQR
jgi:hypothetical protein